jgi:hypothetical protein
LLREDFDWDIVPILRLFMVSPPLSGGRSRSFAGDSLVIGFLRFEASVRNAMTDEE